MTAFNWMRRLLKSERGNVIVIGAATMPLIIGAGAVALDTIQLSLWKRQLQRMADSAALAGVRALVQDPDAAKVTAAATYDLTLNNQVPLIASATSIQPPPTVGAFAGNNNAVRVSVSSQQPLSFWSFFTGSAPTITADATAALVSDGRFCMVALKKGKVTGIRFVGKAHVDLKCGIATNAEGDGNKYALDAGGNSTIIATPIMAVGALETDNAKFAKSALMPYASPQEDPFADRPDPSIAASTMNCNRTAVPDSKGELAPGCFNDFTLNGTVTLKPGTYYLYNTDAVFESHAKVVGDGVTIVFTGDPAKIGKINMKGQGAIDLSAPTTGPYAGIALYRDRDFSGSDLMKLNGGNDLTIEGAMYFPNTHVWFNGGADVKSECLQLIADELTFNGNVELGNTCSTGSGGVEATFVRLVE